MICDHLQLSQCFVCNIDTSNRTCAAGYHLLPMRDTVLVLNRFALAFFLVVSCCLETGTYRKSEREYVEQPRPAGSHGSQSTDRLVRAGDISTRRM